MIPVRSLPISAEEAIKRGWKRLNHGLDRQVFEHPDHHGVVLKIDERQGAYNKRECDLWETHSESFFSFRLTPILARSDDHRAVLMRKMQVLTHGEVASTSPEQKRSWDRVRSDASPLAECFKELIGNSSIGSDLHAQNMGCIQDDYGYHVAGPIVDYAGQ